MKLKYSLLVVLLGAIYFIIKEFVPDLPINQDLFVALIVYVLGKLGIEIVEPVVSTFIAKRFKK